MRMDERRWMDESAARRLVERHAEYLLQPWHLLADYPYLEPEDIVASLQYAARRLDHPPAAA